MVLWWIGNAILLLVVLPVVVILLNRVLAALERTRARPTTFSAAASPSSASSKVSLTGWPRPTARSGRSRSARSGTRARSPSFSAEHFS